MIPKSGMFCIFCHKYFCPFISPSTRRLSGGTWAGKRAGTGSIPLLELKRGHCPNLKLHVRSSPTLCWTVRAQLGEDSRDRGIRGAQIKVLSNEERRNTTCISSRWVRHPTAVAGFSFPLWVTSVQGALSALYWDNPTAERSRELSPVLFCHHTQLCLTSSGEIKAIPHVLWEITF